MKKLKLVLLVLFSSSLVCMENHIGVEGSESRLAGSKRKKTDFDANQKDFSCHSSVKMENRFDNLPDELVSRVFQSGFNTALLPVCKRFNKIGVDVLRQRWNIMKKLPKDSIIPNIIESMKLPEEIEPGYEDFKKLYKVLLLLAGIDLPDLEGQGIDITSKEVLSDLDSKVSSQNNNQNALKLAVKNSWPTVLEVLLEMSGDNILFTKDSGTYFHSDVKLGMVLLDLASSNGHAEVVKVLLRKILNSGRHVSELLSFLYVSQSGANVFEMVPLISAAKNGHIDIVKIFLDENIGVDFLSMQECESSALWWASKNGHSQIVELLLSRGANVNLESDSDSSDFDYDVSLPYFLTTPIMVAALNGHIDVVKMLLDYGASINISDSNNITPLMKASKKGHINIVKMLLDRGADVNFIDEGEEVSALIEAIKGDYVEIVRLLLSKGANVNATDKDGRTAYAISSEKGNPVIVSLLSEKGAML